MSAQVFEEPSKSEMRAACEVAIDQAGFRLVKTPIKVPLPPSLKLNGSLIGDIQSLDADENRNFYVLRPRAIDALPKWLANTARASHELKAGNFYIVVREYTTLFKSSCAAAGAGLLTLDGDNTFETVISYSDVSPEDVDERVSIRVTKMRRNMEDQLELKRVKIKGKYEKIAGIVSQMDSRTADEYLKVVEIEYKTLTNWAAGLSRSLDGVTVNTTEAVLTSLEESIELGTFEDELS